MKGEVTIRIYDSERDFEAVKRIWREVGWLTDEKREEEALKYLLDGVRTWVGELTGSVESVVSVASGSLRYLNDDLPFAGIAGVTTSRIGRRRGLATKLVAHAISQSAAAGAAVCGLEMFDQGYYDRFGFGTGTYEHSFTFDPAALTVDDVPRIPIRLGPDDWERVHKSRIARRRSHGACTIDSPLITRGELLWAKNGFGLGYADETGALTHHLWARANDPESGPYAVEWMAYRTGEELRELLALVKTWSDQVRAVRMVEPPGVQLQDFISRPFRLHQLTRGGKFESQASAVAYWQARILDLQTCLAHTHLGGKEIRFNLSLTDPIADYLPPDAPWRGIGGEYVVRFGLESSAIPGIEESLPTLHASVGAFTRLWLGVLPASGLAISDNLAGPGELIAALDELLRLPTPHFDWDF